MAKIKEQKQTKKYQVKKGDTLEKLGNPAAILKANPGISSLSTGQVIKLPNSFIGAVGGVNVGAAQPPKVWGANIKPASDIGAVGGVNVGAAQPVVGAAGSAMGGVGGVAGGVMSNINAAGGVNVGSPGGRGGADVPMGTGSSSFTLPTLNYPQGMNIPIGFGLGGSVQTPAFGPIGGQTITPPAWLRGAASGGAAQTPGLLAGGVGSGIVNAAQQPWTIPSNVNLPGGGSFNTPSWAQGLSNPLANQNNPREGQRSTATSSNGHPVYTQQGFQTPAQGTGSGLALPAGQVPAIGTGNGINPAQAQESINEQWLAYWNGHGPRPPEGTVYAPGGETSFPGFWGGGLNGQFYNSLRDARLATLRNNVQNVYEDAPTSYQPFGNEVIGATWRL